MDAQPPPFSQGPPAPRAATPFQLFCRYRTPLGPPVVMPDGQHHVPFSCHDIPIPTGNDLRDQMHASRQWAFLGHQPDCVELIARTPNGGEACLRRYPKPLQYDGPMRPSHLFPETNVHQYYHGMARHPYLTPSFNGPSAYGPSSDPSSSHVPHGEGGPAPMPHPPLHGEGGLAPMPHPPPHSLPPHPYQPQMPEFPQQTLTPYGNGHVAQYGSQYFSPANAKAASHKAAKSAVGVRSSRGRKKNLSVAIRGPGNSSRFAVESVPPQPGLMYDGAPSPPGPNYVTAAPTPPAADTPALPSSAIEPSPRVIEIFSDTSPDDGLSSPQDDLETPPGFDEEESSDDSEALEGDYDLRKRDRTQLPEEVNRVLDAIKNNYSGDRAGKHPRRPVRIAIYNELKGQGIKGHFGPRGDLLGGSILRNFTLAQLGMTPALWDFIDYKFGAGKTGHEMLTKEGGKKSRRVQMRAAPTERRRSSDALQDDFEQVGEAVSSGGSRKSSAGSGESRKKRKIKGGEIAKSVWRAFDGGDAYAPAQTHETHATTATGFDGAIDLNREISDADMYGVNGFSSEAAMDDFARRHGFDSAGIPNGPSGVNGWNPINSVAGTNGASAMNGAHAMATGV